MKIDGNDNAYPHHSMADGQMSVDARRAGLTKREYFSITIMQGLCAGRTEYEQPGADVKYAVQLADQLLKELSKPEKK